MMRRSLFTGCLPLYKKDYIEERDEDYGYAEVQNWIKAHPVRQGIDKLDTKAIEKIGTEILKSLSNVPITSSNVGLINEHLVAIAIQSCRIKNFFFDHISDLHIKDKSLVKEIRLRLTEVNTSKL